MAARIVRDTPPSERTLAIPSGLTHNEAVAWVQTYLGEGERIAEFVEYR